MAEQVTDISSAAIKRILVLEDDALIALDIEQALIEMGGVDVAVAHRLETGIELLDKQSFDLAILDVDLGPDNSIALAERLTRDGKPYLFLTGYQSARVHELAADRLLEKPFATEDLAAMAARLLGRTL